MCHCLLLSGVLLPPSVWCATASFCLMCYRDCLLLSGVLLPAAVWCATSSCCITSAVAASCCMTSAVAASCCLTSVAASHLRNDPLRQQRPRGRRHPRGSVRCNWGSSQRGHISPWLPRTSSRACQRLQTGRQHRCKRRRRLPNQDQSVGGIML